MNPANIKQNSPIYEFGRLRLETGSGLLACGDNHQRLPPKVYKCLITLLENSGNVVPKDILASELWPDTFVDDNALTYTVSQLRKAIRDLDPLATYIETVPKIGYRFSAPVLITYASADDETALTESMNSGVIERVEVEDTWIEERNDSSMIPIRHSRPERPRNRLILAIVALAVVAASSIGVYEYLNSQISSTNKSIAVLPLVALDSESQDEVLSLGLTDALITELGRSSEFTVRPLSTVTRSFAERKDPIEVGRALKVDVVVSWHYQLRDSRMRVNAKLLNVASGDQVWSEVLDEKTSDLFAIQDIISSKIASSLVIGMPIGGGPRPEATRRNGAAYQAYLRGRYSWNQRTKVGFLDSLSYFEQAIVLDPKFAEAQIGVADAYLGLYDYGYLPASETIPKATTAVNRALQLSPELSKAFSTLASIEFLYNHDWEATEANFVRAIDLAPNDPTPRLRYGWMMSVIGRLDEGLNQLHIAESFDPTSHVIQANIVENHIFAGNVEEANTRLKSIRMTAPDFSLVHWHQGTVFFIENRLADTVVEFLRALEIEEGNSDLSNKVRQALKTKSLQYGLTLWRVELEKRYAAEYFPPSSIALIGALANDRANTLKWLAEAQRVKDPWILQIFMGPEFKFLRGDPVFESLLTDLKMREV
ncbi:MAG: winged helix-turn-helix domain-containing protein [Acidobacteriota bacterium]|nr:MAG: winged helix-turn-helix domain-containing protein [Acidobacteriota bacterium]